MISKTLCSQCAVAGCKLGLEVLKDVKILCKSSPRSRLGAGVSTWHRTPKYEWGGSTSPLQGYLWSRRTPLGVTLGCLGVIREKQAFSGAIHLAFCRHQSSDETNCPSSKAYFSLWQQSATMSKDSCFWRDESLLASLFFLNKNQVAHALPH